MNLSVSLENFACVGWVGGLSGTNGLPSERTVDFEDWMICVVSWALGGGNYSAETFFIPLSAVGDTEAWDSKLRDSSYDPSDSIDSISLENTDWRIEW